MTPKNLSTFYFILFFAFKFYFYYYILVLLLSTLHFRCSTDGCRRFPIAILRLLEWTVFLVVVFRVCRAIWNKAKWMKREIGAVYWVRIVLPTWFNGSVASFYFFFSFASYICHFLWILVYSIGKCIMLNTMNCTFCVKLFVFS